MTTQGSSDGPSGDGEDGTGDPQQGPQNQGPQHQGPQKQNLTESPYTDLPRTQSRYPGAPEDEPSAYEGTEILPPPTFTTGRYQFTPGVRSNHPPDPILPFVAPPVPRRRRSDWPVLVVAVVISAIVLVACCIAGYVVYATKGSPIS